MAFRTKGLRIFCFLPAGLLTAALTLCSCSTNLTQASLENVPLTQEKFSFFGNIPLFYGNDTLELDQKLLRAYTAAASAEAFPREHCRGVAAIQAQVKQNDEKSAWTLGATIIPFWPILPVDETWTYKLTARIFCDGALVKHVELEEQARIEAIVYGRMRSDLLNESSREMHRKLVQRLSFELNYGQGQLPITALQDREDNAIENRNAMITLARH